MLTAVQQDYFISKFTSASIHLNISVRDTNNQYIDYLEYRVNSSKLVFRFRAALPDVDGLSPKITLVVSDLNGIAAKLATIELLDVDLDVHVRSNKLSRFNDFKVVMDGPQIIWYVNGVLNLNKSIIHHHNPPVFFETDKLILKIFKIIISHELNDYKLLRNILSFWNSCTSFMVDNFRYYQDDDDTYVEQDENNKSTKLNSSEICKIIKEMKKDNFFMFIPNENYTDLVLDYNFTNNNFLGRKICNDVQGNVSTLDFQKDRIKCKNKHANFVMEKGTLKLLKNEQGDSSVKRSTIPIGDELRNARVEIKAKKQDDPTLTSRFYIVSSKENVQQEGKNRGFVEIARLNREKGMVHITILVASSRELHYKFNVNMFDSNEFQVYGIEWSTDYIMWFINDKIIFQANRNYNQQGDPIVGSRNEYPAYLPFDHPFKLYVSLEYDDQSSKRNVSAKRPWLEIESIKIYGEERNLVNDSSVGNNNATSSNDQAGDSSSLTLILIIIIILMGLIMLIIVVILKRTSGKLSKANMEIKLDNNLYEFDDNDDDDDHIYQKYFYENIYEGVNNANITEQAKDNDYLEVFDVTVYEEIKDEDGDETSSNET